MNCLKSAIAFFAAVTTLPAMAADLAPVAPLPEAPLTQQDSVYDWTGFYIGAGGGTGYLLDSVSIPLIGVSTVGGVGGRGFFGKVTAGYDHMFSNGIVVGAAVSGRYGDVETSWTVPLLTGSVTADYGIDVTGRLGYAITPRTLAYVLGGYSWQHFELSTPFAALSTTWEDSGFVAGLGLETAVTDHWTWSSEYRYSQYSGTTLGPLGNISIDPVTHTFHTSINYRFGGGPSGIQRNAFVHDWNGLKVGGAISAGISVNELTALGGLVTFDGLATEGFLGEINVGYDREFGERWVAGVMLAAEYVGFSSSFSALGATATVEADDFGFDALLRAGYKVNDYTLGYVIGGYTWQRLSASGTGIGLAASTTVDVNALTVGAGTELALSEKTSAYIEYRYTDYEDVSFGLLTLEPSSHTVRVQQF
ncbi:outer membrane protein [Hoeflea sp.]|uniref:outer membrane protein n=1 Tax=Hoeflea sp. TaxID=1940281 RepID=UPI003B019DCF